jgi:hypothetical protein
VGADTDTHTGQEADEEHIFKVSGTWTPAPEGYLYNLGEQFVPMPIQGPDGHIWPAKFTKVEYSDNPMVHRFQAGSPTPYSDHLYATPFFDLRQCPWYTVADVWFLSTCYPYQDEVDLGIKALRNQTVQAEVHWYQGHEYHLNHLQQELFNLENQIGMHQMEKDHVADDSLLHQARKLTLKGKVGLSRSKSKPDAETSHAPTTQDNSGVFSAVIPLFKVRREVSH